MPFRSIVGHHHVVELLRRAVARDSLPPSLILSGPEGVGKRTVALALAQVLNCPPSLAARSGGARAPSPRGSSGEASTSLVIDACGECPACRRIQRGSYPDVIQVGIEGDATIIKVEQVRAVLEVVGFRPYEGRRRVVIIDPADGMDRFGQNALLKVLEETPPATVFVLVTARPDALYATIRSRCPQIRVGALSVAEITEVLMRERGLPERDARAAAIVAAGSVSRAMEAVSEDSTDARSQALTVLQEAAAVREPPPSPGAAAPCYGEARRRLLEAMKGIFGMEKRQGSAAAEREQIALSLQALSSLLRDVTMIGANGAARDLANADLRAELEQVAGSFGGVRVMRAFAAVDRAIAALGSNANPKIVVDWLAFQI